MRWLASALARRGHKEAGRRVLGWAEAYDRYSLGTRIVRRMRK